MRSLSGSLVLLGAVLTMGVASCGQGAVSDSPRTAYQRSAQQASPPPAAADESRQGADVSASSMEPAAPHGEDTSLGGVGAAKQSAPAAGAAPATAEAERSARSRPAPHAEALQPVPDDRPGLATAWGETMHSPTTTAPFVRGSDSPFAVSTLWYNDREGARAMSRWADYRAYERAEAPALGGGLTIYLRSESSRPLTGFYAGGKYYVVGEVGERYVIVIQNHTQFRYECVASVDGLDVINGRPASYANRGYLIQPYGTLEIDGFRRSEDAVAAFRFSSVRGSYAVRSGQGDRNVGVIGVAFFHEEGTHPSWSPDDIRRRQTADPFPAQYAVPPSR